MSTPAQIVDSYGAIELASVKPYGFKGVARYISLTPGKCETPQEFQTYRDAGLTQVWVYEDNANDGLGGVPVGAAKGQVARRVLNSFGVPAGRVAVVYFAFDFPIQPDDYFTGYEAAIAFGNAAATTPAIYGPAPFIKYCFGKGIEFGWMPGASSWNEGVFVGQLYQRRYGIKLADGNVVDIDDILAPDYGQWPRPQAPEPPKPQPSEEEKMVITFANGKYLCGGVSPQGHPLVFTADNPAGPWSVCDLTDDIHAQDPNIPEYTVTA